jgi:GNAT superfamily N-acetyltransferase
MPDLLVRLYALPEVTSLVNGLAARSIRVRRAMPYEKYAVVKWVETMFSQGWAGECDVAFSNHPVSCFIATEAGKIVGFACHDCTCRDFFGPTGVDENKRGIGIGKALLLSCLHAMAAQGYAYAVIGGAGPTDFFVHAVGAMPIDGSTPGIYRDQLIIKE